MTDIPDEAVRAAVVAGDHLVNDEWVRDMLAAALPHLSHVPNVGKEWRLELRIRELEQELDAAEESEGMLREFCAEQLGSGWWHHYSAWLSEVEAEMRESP